MHKDELKKRTKEFALRAIKLVDALPRKNSGEVLGKQLLRRATSVGANYRSACRGRSIADFIAKLGIVIEEADESEFWIERIEDCGLMTPKRVRPLRKEASELVAIFTASVTTARSNLQKTRAPAKNQKSKI
jgi:four helix bundle protein